jgi:hypothetical protein
MSEQDDERPDLDDELRRLFADDRLDLPVARNAGAAVAAQARRRRRNRVALTAAGGVLAVVAVVFAGVVLSGIGRPGTVSSATGPVLTTTIPTVPTVPTMTSPSPTPPQAVPDGRYLVLGPYGYSKLVLGMPWQQAAASGLFRSTVPAVMSAGCLRYTVLFDELYLLPTKTAPTAGSSPGASPVPFKGKLEVLVSVRNGVVQLIGGPLLRTPEGIGVGTPRQALAQAYPTLKLPSRGGTTAVQVRENPGAMYVFGLSGTGTVTSFSLRLAKSDCLG